MALSSGGGSSIRAGSAFVELFTKDDKLRAGLKSATDTLRGFANGMATVGLGLVGVGAAAGSALAGIFTAASQRDTTFYRLSQQLGETSENLSSFAYAAETTGQSLDRILDNFENWPERVIEAAKGGGMAADSFRTLGLEADALARKPLVQQMIDLSAAMSKVTNESERLQILGNLFSDKGQGFNELFRKGPEGIRALMGQAGDVGATVSSANAKAAADVSAAWAKAYAAVKYSVLSVGDVMLDNAAADKAVAEQVTNLAIRTRAWVAENRNLVSIVGASAAGLVALGGSLVAASLPFRLLASSISPVYSVLSTITRGALTPVAVGFTALRVAMSSGGAALSATWTAAGAAASAGAAVAAASYTALAGVTRALTGATYTLSGAYLAARAVFSGVAAVVGGGLMAAYGVARAALLALYAAATLANVKLVAQAAVVGACQAAMAAFSVGLLAVQAAQRAVVSALLATEAAVMAAAGALAAAPAAIGAAWTGLKAIVAAAGAALVVAVETVFASTVALKAAWIAGSIAMSAAWSAFVAAYTATGALVSALPTIFGAMWAAGSAVASAAWAAFVAVWQVGQATLTAGVAILKAAIFALPLAIVGLIGYWLLFSDQAKNAMADLSSSIKQWFGEAFENVKEAWGGISKAIARGDLELAFSIGLAALKTEWARALVFLTTAWNNFKKLFVDGWRDAALTFTNIWATAIHGTAELLIDTNAARLIYSKEEIEQIRKIMADDAAKEQAERINARIREQAGADKARAAQLDAAKDQLASAEKEQQYLLLVNKMRENFALLKGGAVAGGKGSAGNDVLGTLLTTRATYGGSASLGFFGGAGSPFGKLEAATERSNSLLANIEKGISLLANALLAQQKISTGTLSVARYNDLMFEKGK